MVVAAGAPGLIRGEDLLPGATVIDVGTTLVNGMLRGDVDFESAAAVAGAITPVPGGVGPVTNVALLRNVVKAAKFSQQVASYGAAKAPTGDTLRARTRGAARSAAPASARARTAGGRRRRADRSRATGRLLSTIVTAMQASRYSKWAPVRLCDALDGPRAAAHGEDLDDRIRLGAHRHRARYFRRAGEDDYIEVFTTPPLERSENFPHRSLDIAFVADRR